MFNYENTSSAFHYCLVLLTFTFTKNSKNFEYDFFGHVRALLKRKEQPDKKIVNSRNFKLAEDFNHHVFSGPKIFFEYRERPWTETISKFIKKMVFVPFSWVIYLLFQYYDHLNFLVYKSASSGLSKELVVGTALHQCLVLLLPTFIQNFTNFDLDEFLQFRAL